MRQQRPHGDVGMCGLSSSLTSEVNNVPSTWNIHSIDPPLINSYAYGVISSGKFSLTILSRLGLLFCVPQFPVLTSLLISILTPLYGYFFFISCLPSLLDCIFPEIRYTVVYPVPRKL